VESVFVSAFISSVRLTACAAGIGARKATVGKVPLTPAFHALYGFMFQSIWVDPHAADVDAVSDADVSSSDIPESECCVCGALFRRASARWFDPAGFE
jgi:hypothetical protein